MHENASYSSRSLPKGENIDYKRIVSRGLLSPSEFQALTDINREAFNPLYREILPNTGCYKQPSE
jgi:hypothetical protein